MIQAVLFDLNGVIVDDEPLHLKCFQEALGAEGIVLKEEDYMSMLGMDDTTFVRTAFARAEIELSDATLDAVIAREAAMHRGLIENELPLFPGVVTFIKALARNYPLAVVSMAERAEVDYALERARLAAHFSAVVSAEDVDACKPDPQCYLLALKRLNQKRSESHVLPLNPYECLVIEDSPPGIQSGRSAGMRTLAVTNTVIEVALRAAGAEVVTHSLADWTVSAVKHVFDRE
jgi:phosphoglycolate phosphatase/beta-phosphoglucomutase